MNDTVLITSTRGNPPLCHITWDGVDRYATVADVRTTAEDLMSCAAYADLLGELLRIGLDGRNLTGLLQSILQRRDRPYFGTKTTLFALPAGSSKRKVGMVLIARRNTFHEGGAHDGLTPDEARVMARHWIGAAEASESDTLFDRVLRKAGWLSDDDLNAVFSLLADVRGGAVTLDES